MTRGGVPADEHRTVAKTYFEAIASRDVDAMVACWRPGGREFIRGQVDTTAPDGVRQFFTELFAAVPDFDLQVEEMVVDKGRAAVRWRATGTFGGDAPFKGFEPNGARLELEGCDVLQISDGLIDANDAFSDAMAFARQIGRDAARRAPPPSRRWPRCSTARARSTRGWPQARSRRSPKASGSSAAASPPDDERLPRARR